ncbi:MAG: hypothetical protein ACYCV7_16910 [Acidimicrobiales bacterium]
MPAAWCPAVVGAVATAIGSPIGSPGGTRHELDLQGARRVVHSLIRTVSDPGDACSAAYRDLAQMVPA